MTGKDRYLALIDEMIEFYSEQIKNTKMFLEKSANKEFFEVQEHNLKQFIKSLELLKKEFITFHYKND